MWGTQFLWNLETRIAVVLPHLAPPAYLTPPTPPTPLVSLSRAGIADGLLGEGFLGVGFSQAQQAVQISTRDG